MTMRRMDTEEVTQRIAVNDPKQSLDVLGVYALEQKLIVDGGKIIVSIIGEKSKFEIRVFGAGGRSCAYMVWDNSTSASLRGFPRRIILQGHCGETLPDYISYSRALQGWGNKGRMGSAG